MKALFMEVSGKTNNCVLVKVHDVDPYAIKGVGIVDFRAQYDTKPISGTVVATADQIFSYERQIRRLRRLQSDVTDPLIGVMAAASVEPCDAILGVGDTVIFRYHYHIADIAQDSFARHERAFGGHYVIDYHDIVARVRGDILEPVGGKLIVAIESRFVARVLFGSSGVIVPGVRVIVDTDFSMRVFSVYQRFGDYGDNLYEIMASDVKSILTK